MIELILGCPRSVTQSGGDQKIGIRYLYDDSDGCGSTDNVGTALLSLSAVGDKSELQCQTLLYFKSMKDELADGEFRSTPNQSNPNVYKRRSGNQSQLSTTVGYQAKQHLWMPKFCHHK